MKPKIEDLAARSGDDEVSNECQRSDDAGNLNLPPLESKGEPPAIRRGKLHANLWRVAFTIGADEYIVAAPPGHTCRFRVIKEASDAE